MAPTPAEERAIDQVRKYEQPTCPGCGKTMQLWYGMDPSGITYGAYYECRNEQCEAQWHTYPKHSINAAHACFDAWKAAMNRVPKTRIRAYTTIKEGEKHENQ